jgi:uncharacterized protein with beta-barrel porin domain
VAARLFNNTAQPFTVEAVIPNPGVIISAGVAGNLSERLLLSLNYRGSFQDGGHRHQGTGSLVYRF